MKGLIVTGLALAAVAAGGCAAAPAGQTRHCGRCEKVVPFSSKARVEWENTRWMCREAGGKSVDCTKTPSGCPDCLAHR